MKTLFLLPLLWLGLCAHALAAFDPGRAPFGLWLNDYPVRHTITFRALLPGEILTVKVQDGVTATLDGKPVALENNAYRWLTPAKSQVQLLRLQDPASGKQMEVRLFGLVPATDIVDGKLNGYRIGTYPKPHKGLASYQAPKGYIALTPETEKLMVSPHFRLGEFKCKQSGGYPKYLVLRPRLLEKLELLLEELNQRGVHAPGFVIMSGYRTPHYNRSIGNVSGSRHLYGGAADVYVDVDRNGSMDDLNGDGRADIGDARYLYAIADQLVKQTGLKELTGGVGLYDKNAFHGPFVHVDVRGARARWGD